jgi:hypothetical protein
MSGEALTTHASLTMDLVLQFLGRHLDDGDAPMRELVDELRAARAGDLGRLRLGELAVRVPEQGRSNPHLFNELGRRQPQRREPPSGTSNVIVGMGLGLSSIRIPRWLLRTNR